MLWVNIYFNTERDRLEWGEYKSANLAAEFAQEPPFGWTFLKTVEVETPKSNVEVG